MTMTDTVTSQQATYAMITPNGSPPLSDQIEIDYLARRSAGPCFRPASWWRQTRATTRVVGIVVLLVFNVAGIAFALTALSTDSGHQCPGAREKPREVVAPLCLPCQELTQEQKGRWRRYGEAEGSNLCCPLRYDSLSFGVRHIYQSVLGEQQRNVNNASPVTFSSLQAFYREPTNTEETVLFANNNKPSAHVTGVQPYDANKYFTPSAANSSQADDNLQTVSDWPLRFEPYRSTTRGYVQRLTWGLVVPVTGLYRVHSTVNFYFSTYSQDTRQRRPEDRQRPFHVVHQLSRYRRATDTTSHLTQRNQTVSARYTDGLTSFLVTVEKLEVGDVISVTLSHHAAMAMRDRWHSQGLFLLQ